MRKKTDPPSAALHPRFGYDLENCGIKRALDTLGEKWTLLILREAFYGLQRFDDFARALNCGRGVLSARLKMLVRSDVLVQRNYVESGRRPRAAYHLTAKGRDLYPVILALSQWSDRWAPPRGGPGARITSRKTGKSVTVVMTDRSDVRSLSIADISIRPGPSARRLA